jgi:hypothetical protein
MRDRSSLHECPSGTNGLPFSDRCARRGCEDIAEPDLLGRGETQRREIDRNVAHVPCSARACVRIMCSSAAMAGSCDDQAVRNARPERMRRVLTPDRAGRLRWSRVGFRVPADGAVHEGGGIDTSHNPQSARPAQQYHPNATLLRRSQGTQQHLGVEGRAHHEPASHREIQPGLTHGRVVVHACDAGGIARVGHEPVWSAARRRASHLLV